KQSEKEVLRLNEECGREYAELAQPFRARVAAVPTDWLVTQFPTVTDLETARQTVQGLATARQEQEQLREAQTRWQSLNAQVGAAQQELADLAATLTADPEAIRRDLRRFDSE